MFSKPKHNYVHVLIHLHKFRNIDWYFEKTNKQT